MKILHIINDLDIAGAQKVVHDLALCQKQSGDDVSVALLSSNGSFFEDNLRNAGVNLIYSGHKRSVYSPKHIFSLSKIMRGYDVIHVHLFPALYWVAFAKIISGLKTRLIFTEHNTTNRRRDNKILHFVDKLVYKHFDAIAACSEKAAETFAKDFPHIGIDTVSNGVDVTAIENSQPSDRKNLGYSEDDIIVTMVARFDEPKRQDLLIRAVALTPENVKLMLLGDGPKIQDCRDLAEELGISDRVKFMGKRSDVPALLKASDIVSLISEYEGLSLSSIEGMSSDSAFIGSDVQGIKEIVNGAGILVNNDPTEISQAITDLCDAQHRKDIASACLKRAKEYDLSKMDKKYRTLYN